MVDAKLKDAANAVKSLARQFEAVIAMASAIDELSVIQSQISEFDSVKEKKKAEIANLEASVVEANNRFTEVEGKIFDLENKAKFIISVAEKKAVEIERTGVFDAKVLTDNARAEAEKIVKAAKNDAAAYDSKIAVAKNKLAEIESGIEKAKAELGDIEAKKLAAVQYVKDALGV